ncbi:protein mono-ADP-ribosyltransferase TIPARP-like isoform X2 [Hemicordylus capensis]|uniref:protein mono-ADP-ribosyltransferase TIPARP-like isoform X2 n=1 Tax=Hemicordylus capensis TaxID=884348 RepID=UPI002302A0CC|nr:protein mono-ADP-ribosyltransferase TIPARP-like isoform X2 [Hemicordylus capensis]
MAESPECSQTELGHSSSQDVLLGFPILRPSGTVPYHVHQRDGVLICDKFLLGQCPLEEQCPQHHTPFPYHWQWQNWKDCVWLSFSFSAQHHLEKLYCTKTFVSAHLKNRRIRRLSNSSDPQCNPYFPAEWEVYWMEFGEWIKYSKSVAEELVSAFQRGMWNHTFRLNDCLYNVDLKRLTQCNIKTGFTRRIMFRPVLRSCAYIASYLESIASSHTKTIHGEDPQNFYCGSYPAAALIPPPQEGTAFTMVEITLAEMAYQTVSRLFHATMSEKTMLVLAIYRIRNDHLWQAYVRQKEFMAQRRSLEDPKPLERHLFHGTGAAHIQSICTVNFDPNLAGLHGTVYGKGCYFAKDASYSHNYASPAKDHVRHMFLTKVLTGSLQLGRQQRKQASVWFDSCTNNVDDPSIFVIFKSCQCYPYFLIRYKAVDTPVAVD